MNEINGKLQVQRISWIENKSIIFKTSENTGSNNFMDRKLSNNFMDRKFHEAVKFITKIFKIINMDIQSIHIRYYYTIFSKFFFYQFKKFVIKEVSE